MPRAQTLRIYARDCVKHNNIMSRSVNRGKLVIISNMLQLKNINKKTQ